MATAMARDSAPAESSQLFTGADADSDTRCAVRPLVCCLVIVLQDEVVRGCLTLFKRLCSSE